MEISHHSVASGELTLHATIAGEGPPVVLLHGFPETWFAWRHQIPVLAERYTVIAPDLRGCGSSDKPAAGYDKRSMAGDIVGMLRVLGYESAAVVGHDRGARVALRMAKDHPDVVERLAVLDNVPTKVIFDSMDARIAAGHWLFSFNRVSDLPEALIAGREAVWIRHFLSTWTYGREVFTPEEIGVYIDAVSQPGALRGALADYRAVEQDLVHDAADEDTRLACPLLALWGTEFELVGRMFNLEAVWKAVADDLTTVEIPQCGHLPHEERPHQVNSALLSFLDGLSG